MVPRLELSIVICLLCNYFEEFGKVTSKRTSVSHLPTNILQKFSNFIVKL